MSDNFSNIEFGKLLSKVDSIHDDILEIKADVKTQNSRVYKLEAKADRFEGLIESHTHKEPDKMSLKDRAMQQAPVAGGAAVMIALIEVIKILVQK